MKKYFFSEEDIAKELAHVEKLHSENKLENSSIPDYYCKGVSEKNKTINLSLAIIAGVFALDRFYLGKTLSAIVKLSFTFLLPLLLLLLAFYTKAMINFEIDMIMYFIIVGFVGTSFYLYDIYIAYKKPRDGKYRCLGGK